MITHQKVAHRWITEPSEEVLDLRGLRKSFGYERQKFDAVDQLRRWRTHDAAERVVEKGLFKVRPSGEGQTFIRLSHEIEFFADNVQEIVVVAKGLRKGKMRLFWTIPGETFVDERKIVLDAAGAEMKTYRFPVASHPNWQGRVRAIRLDVPNIAGQEVALRSFETRGREGYEAEMLARIVGQDWKIEADFEARNAIVTPPDVPRSWKLPKRSRGKLRFAYGLPKSNGPAVSFKVSAAGRKTPLFEATVDPSDATRAGRWIEAEIELKRKVKELVFEATASEGYRLEAGLPAWGSPEILAPASGDRRPNIVLISIDTVRPDRLGVYGYDLPTSPNIDRWARSSAITFRRAVATAPWTLPSHVSMFSGLDALRHGVNHHLPAPKDLDLLPEILRRQGYLTAAVTGGGWLHPDQGLAQGFDIFRYWGLGTASEQELESGIQHTLQMLEKSQDRELFLFFHTYEAHDPFRRRQPWAERCPPAPEEGLLYGAIEDKREAADGFALRYGFRRFHPGESAVHAGERISDDELPLVSCLYDSGIHYVDHHLGRVFERLEELDPERQTLVILTSDHGESLGEDGYVKHAYLLDSNLLVPLIIGLPGGRGGGKTVEAQVSSVDIVPTILAAVGLEEVSGIDGTSLLPLISGRDDAGPRQALSYAGSANYGLSLRLDDRSKYIYNNTAWEPLGGTEKFYDLQEDAEERSDRAAVEAENLEPLRQQLVEYLKIHRHGVSVAIDHQGCGELNGELYGLPVHIARVKAAQPPGERFEWLGKRHGRFRLQPGETLDLLLEAAVGSVTVSGALAPCEGNEDSSERIQFRQSIDLDRLETWGVGFDGRTWQEELAEEEPGTGGASQARIVLRREGRGVTGSGSQELDPALVEQLKALGYLND